MEQLNPVLSATTEPKLKAPLLSDMAVDFRLPSDTLFLMVELSDAMRRGVQHFRLDGSPLASFNDVLEALIVDGEVLFDDEWSVAPRGH